MTEDGFDDGGSTDPALDGVLFDLDGTLCEYRRTTGDMLEVVHEAVGVEDPIVTEREYVAKYAEFATESEDMVDLRERCFVAVARENDRDPDLARELARTYAERRDHGNVRAIPGAVEAVESLADRHPLGLITNGAPEMQRRKLAALGIADAFDVTVFAGYDGVEAKPATEPFELAVSELDLRPERSVYVGNSHRADVCGAKAAGVGAALFTGGEGGAAERDPDPAPDYVIDSMEDLSDPPWA